MMWKFLLIILLWGLMTVALGLLGASWLRAWWRSTQDQLVVREAALVSAICRSQPWSQPWESDPNWKRLETDWNLDIVPIYRDALEAERWSSIAAMDPQGNEWTQTIGGPWRISRAVPLSSISTESETHGVIGVRVTRVADELPINRLWWSLVGITALLGTAVVALALRTLAWRTQQRQAAIQAWGQLTQQEQDALKARLPQVGSTEDDQLHVQLSIVGERVNRWLEELQNSVRRSELVLSNLLEGVLAVDANSRVILANAAVARLLHMSGADDLQRPLFEVVRLPRIIAVVDRALESQTSQEESFEHGTERLNLRVRAHPVPLGDGQIGALVTVRDETLLRRIDAVRRDFVTNASHELKTPLAAIRLYAETLQMGVDDPEQLQRFLSEILAQADRINGLINGMLQLARVQASDARLRRVDFDIVGAIRNCFSSAEAMAKSKGVHITKSLPDSPLKLLSDPDGVETVVSNLLSNAVRYTPSGGRVVLTVQPEGAWLVISVEDTGIGIAKEDLDRIFERFYRVERARSAETGGTGLGLSIVRHLVQALGGQIHVTSQPQVGSCFVVRIPNTGSGT